jgi:hypothetical protein
MVDGYLKNPNDIPWFRPRNRIQLWPEKNLCLVWLPNLATSISTLSVPGVHVRDRRRFPEHFRLEGELK